jgi:Spy/CpxP family protein refolding chaperone
MNPLIQCALTVIVITYVTSQISAQDERAGDRPYRPSRNPTSQLTMLTLKPVQADLKLTTDQIDKVREAVRKQLNSRTEIAPGLPAGERIKKNQELTKQANDAAAEILKPDQAKRLRQIILQMEGGRALIDPEIAKELNLTAEQKQKLMEIRDAATKEYGEVRRMFRNRPIDRKRMEEEGKIMTEMHEKYDAQLMALLTKEQKEKWREMAGQPFKGFVFGPGGRKIP